MYVYRLPACSFEHARPSLATGRPSRLFDKSLGGYSILATHDRIVQSGYITNDPAEASVFYVPAVFGDWLQPENCTQNLGHGGHWFFQLEGPTRLSAAGVELPGEALWESSGPFQRTLSVWVKLARGGRRGGFPLVTTGAPVPGGSYDLCYVDGCFAISTGGAEDGSGGWHFADCGKQPLDDGHWHFLAASYDGATSQLWLDGELVGNHDILISTGQGTARLGGNAQRRCVQPAAAPLRGQLRDLRFSSSAMSSDSMIRVCGGAGSTRNPCARFIRGIIEASPWFQRNRGWDHVALVGGQEYPDVFDPHGTNPWDHYGLELFWPDFGHFMLLHLGARAERCMADLQLGGLVKDPRCEERFYRIVTIPPLLDFLHEGQGFDCLEIAARVRAQRTLRIAYRGLAYGAMVERVIMQRALQHAEQLIGLQRSGQIRVEFTNWSRELVRQNGICRPRYAFEGLCSWNAVGRQPLEAVFLNHKERMRNRSLQLLRSSDFCLVLPGDGGWELRLYGAINSGCIPVIIYMENHALPKIPFAALLPWEDMALFWQLDHHMLPFDLSEELLVKSALQLFLSLLSVTDYVLAVKRKALREFGPRLSWFERDGCGENQVTAVDLLMQELAHKARFPEAKQLTPEQKNWKIPMDKFQKSWRLDVVGNGCPLGYPTLVSHFHEPAHGDVCNADVPDVGWGCPEGCALIRAAPYCEAAPGAGEPCRAQRPGVITRPVSMTADLSLNGFPRPPRQPRLALISYSRRPATHALLWPKLRRFAESHAMRYDLVLEDVPFYREERYHESFSKWGLVRRALKYYDYDACVWMDDDIMVTAPLRDPIYEAIVRELFAEHEKHILFIPREGDALAPAWLGGGVLVVKRGFGGMKIVDEILAIGDGDPECQDWQALDKYVKQHGTDAFVAVEGRKYDLWIGVSRRRQTPSSFLESVPFDGEGAVPGA